MTVLTGAGVRAAVRAARDDLMAAAPVDARWGSVLAPDKRQADHAARATSNTTMAMAPTPSTVQSAAMPGCGSLTRAGPNSTSGDATIATRTASATPTIAAVRTSSSMIVSSCARVAPMARRVEKSTDDTNNSRAATCPTTTSAARAASNAKIASAAACGLIARSIFAA